MDSTNAAGNASTLPSWADRCSYWLSAASMTPARRRREREQYALVLTGQGLRIYVNRGCLCVRDGNTHFPADKREYRFFNGALDIPPAIVVIDGSGEITLDAIDWLASARSADTFAMGRAVFVNRHGRRASGLH